MSYSKPTPNPDSLPSIFQSGTLLPPWRSGTENEVTSTALRTVSTTETHVHNTPTSHDRRELIALQEQLKAFKEDLKTKDELITQLSSIDSKVLSSRQSDHGNIETVAADAASLRVKLHAAQTELLEVKTERDTRTAQLAQVRSELEEERAARAQNEARCSSLQQRVQQLEESGASLEQAAERGSMAVGSLQAQSAAQQQKIADLTAELRIMEEEREHLRTTVTRVEQEFSECRSSMARSLGVEPDAVSTKIQELQREAATLSADLKVKTEELRAQEVETKAARETIQRLSVELSRLREAREKDTQQQTEARLELEQSNNERHRLQAEVTSLEERLAASERTWEVTKSELRDKELRLTSLGTEIQQSGQEIQRAVGEMRNFRSQLRSLLSGYVSSEEQSDNAYLSAIQQLLDQAKRMRGQADQSESTIKTLAAERDSRQAERDQAGHNVQRLQAEVDELSARLKRLQDDMAAGEALRETLGADKQKYMQFLEQLARALRLDRIAHDVGFDMNAEALLTRAEQLVRKETDDSADRKTYIYNLQRKVKALKEQLESKDLHLDLLRKKIAGLEEKLAGKSGIERERDTESLRTRKLNKALERHQKELAESRAQVRELKAELLDHTQYRLCSSEQSTRIGEMEAYVSRLEHTQQAQKREINDLNETVEFQKQSSAEQATLQQNAVKALSSELRTTKISLEEAIKREKQLVDLREVVARLLGLDVAALAVPDYEIISRLEKLVQSHTAHVYTSAALDSALEDMEDGFRMGYGDPRARRRPRPPGWRSGRPRSASPSRFAVRPGEGRDPKATEVRH